MQSGRGNILVVEDEEAIAGTIVYALETEGYTPIWKATGREALQAMRDRRVDLVVLDVGLPDTSGL